MKYSDFPMQFELMCRQFLGDIAYHEANAYGDEKYYKKIIIKCINKLNKDIDALDTTNRHKERILSNIQDLKDALNNGEVDYKEAFTLSFMLISRLIGYDYVVGRKYNTPFYYQTSEQYYDQKVKEGNDWGAEHRDKDNFISLRKKVYNYLKNEDCSDFVVAQVLNTSEYQIKKLKKGL
ncbi:MAG: hypothetical protein WD607_08920 [Candidatus Paceibacterota bacterium]